MAVNMDAVLKVRLLGYFKEQLVKIFAPKDLATVDKEGLLSAADKAKLDGIEENATNYQHPDTHPATIIVEDDTHKFITAAERVKWDGATTAVNALRAEYDAHIDSIVEITEAEVDTMLVDAGLGPIS